MTNEDAFLAAILDAPDDDAPRLLYADWLDEHDQPSRAEFIRVQCSMFRRSLGPAGPVSEESSWLQADAVYQSLRRRERELMALRDEGPYAMPTLRHWTPHPLIRCVPHGAYILDHLTFRRGFVEEVTCTAAAWLKHGPAVVRAAPVRVVRLSNREPERMDPLTYAHAIAAMSDACLAWARGQDTIPALTRRVETPPPT